MHLCRGNYRSTYMGSGAYDAVADVLFNRIKVHGYFMEYDTERAGRFEPLRLLPKERAAVLGLVTTKTGQLESKDRLNDASRRPRNTPTSINSACRRNAASPRPRKAIRLPKTSNGQSFG
jgi:methionine synthase II (cobalamin-independent)